MMNTVKNTTTQINKKNDDINKTRYQIFGNEYNAEIKIDFQKMKDLIQERHGKGRVIRDYNYRLISPTDLCDLFLKDDYKLNIEYLNKLPNTIKRCLVDLLMELTEIEHIKSKFGESMLFWIRHNGYEYASRHKEMKDFLIQNTSFIGSRENYNTLSRSFASMINYHHNNYNENITLKLFQISKNLDDELKKDKINKILNKLGEGFGLGMIHTKRDDTTKGKVEGRERKDLDKDGKEICHDKIENTTKYKKHIIKNQGNIIITDIEIVDRKNPDIHNDRSGSSYQLYLDSPIGITLYHNNLPIAIIGFSVSEENTIFINQMQKVSKHNYDRYGRTIKIDTAKITQTIPRQQTLYDIIKEIAIKYGFKKIEIQSGINNERTEKHQTELTYDEYYRKRVSKSTDKVHLLEETSKKIYDEFAKKNNFKKDQESKNWFKNII